MKEQQKKIISLKRRRAFAWVVLFALLFSMLAVPMTPTMPRTEGEQLVWGNFCTGGGSKLVATSSGLVDQSAPRRDNHAAMQHCFCCSGYLSLVAVPAGMTLGFVAVIQPVNFPNRILFFSLTPQLQRPDLNPRASPRV